MDTVVADSVGAGHLDSEPFVDPEELDRQTAAMLIQYAVRVVSDRTTEKYDLAVVATEDENLLRSLADLSRGGKAVLGVNSQILNGAPGLLHEKLSELANSDGGVKV